MCHSPVAVSAFELHECVEVLSTIITNKVDKVHLSDRLRQYSGQSLKANHYLPAYIQEYKEIKKIKRINPYPGLAKIGFWTC